jgi:hypothetical protein
MRVVADNSLVEDLEGLIEDGNALLQYGVGILN